MSGNAGPSDPSSFRMATTDFHGRKFGAHKPNQWLFPVDPDERDRCDIFFNLLKAARNDHLYQAPVTFAPPHSVPQPHPEAPRGHQILDLGTGSGLWPISMAEKYPETIVCGVDLYDNQHPIEVVPGRTYFTGGIDVEDPWSMMYDFFDFASMDRERSGIPNARIEHKRWDLIRASMLNGAIKSWPAVYRQMIDHLTPGTGCVELIEIDWMPRCDDGTMSPTSDYKRWAEDLLRVMDGHGRSMRIDGNTRVHLESAGFIDVQETKLKVLCNPWRNTDSQEECVARWFSLGLTYGLESMSLRPFMAVLNMPPDQFGEMIRKVKYESSLLRYHMYCYVHIWTARRPRA